MPSSELWWIWLNLSRQNVPLPHSFILLLHSAMKSVAPAAIQYMPQQQRKQLYVWQCSWCALGHELFLHSLSLCVTTQGLYDDIIKPLCFLLRFFKPAVWPFSLFFYLFFASWDWQRKIVTIILGAFLTCGADIKGVFFLCSSVCYSWLLAIF